jgi:hypothetical protein
MFKKFLYINLPCQWQAQKIIPLNTKSRAALDFPTLRKFEVFLELVEEKVNGTV